MTTLGKGRLSSEGPLWICTSVRLRNSQRRMVRDKNQVCAVVHAAFEASDAAPKSSSGFDRVGRTYIPCIIIAK